MVVFRNNKKNICLSILKCINTPSGVFQSALRPSLLSSILFNEICQEDLSKRLPLHFAQSRTNT